MVFGKFGLVLKLLYIYDKSEMENVSDQFLAYLMR